MSSPTMHRTATHTGRDATLDSLGDRPGRYVSFGKYRNYVEAINLPRTIEVGGEYVSTTEPFIILNRKLSVLQELFQKPYFHIARKIRIKFHWEGIHVLGANMEEPNCFLLPISLKENVPNNWFLKLSCLPECSPGKKSLYVSIEILRESLFRLFFVSLAKIFAALSLLIALALPFFYFISKSVRVYVNNWIGISGTGTISLAAVIFFSIWIISKQFEEVFPRFVPDQEISSLVITDSHSKDIVLSALNVIKGRSRGNQE